MSTGIEDVDRVTAFLEDHDPVESPRHYRQGDIECIDAIEAALGPLFFSAFCRGNIIKYVWRSGLKNDTVEDLKKARWYCNRAIQSYEKFRGSHGS